jgi:branched-chain amino acid transport system ATP-binding protein
VSLIGRNGVGRSTTIKAIMGMVDARGSVRFKGEEIVGLPTFRIAHKGLGYVPENRDVFPTLTVAQNLALGEKARGARGRWSPADMFELFPRLAERRDTHAGVLSGGEQQMLTLARTLMGDPDLVMVDEPTEGLAPKLVELVAGLFREIKRRGVALLLVEQKLAITLDLSERLYVMGHGRIVFEGSPAALRGSSTIRREWLEV